MNQLRNDFMFGLDSLSQSGITFEEKIGHGRVMFLDKIFVSILDHTDGAEDVVGKYDATRPNCPSAQMMWWDVLEAMDAHALTVDEASYLMWQWYDSMHDDQ